MLEATTRPTLSNFRALYEAHLSPDFEDLTTLWRGWSGRDRAPCLSVTWLWREGNQAQLTPFVLGFKNTKFKPEHQTHLCNLQFRCKNLVKSFRYQVIAGRGGSRTSAWISENGNNPESEFENGLAQIIKIDSNSLAKGCCLQFWEKTRFFFRFLRRLILDKKNKKGPG